MKCLGHCDTSLRLRPGVLLGGLGGAIAVSLALSAPAAFAAEGGRAEPSEVLFLGQLIVLMLVGRLLGEAMTRIGQPSVMGMLLAGILLGPSVLGVLWPELQQAIFPKTPEQKTMLDGIAQLGILLLLLLTGMETDLELVRKVGRAALTVSLSGVALPFICGFALGQIIPEALLPHGSQRLVTSLFLGTALSISSIKIVRLLGHSLSARVKRCEPHFLERLSPPAGDDAPSHWDEYVLAIAYDNRINVRGGADVETRLQIRRRRREAAWRHRGNHTAETGLPA